MGAVTGSAKFLKAALERNHQGDQEHAEGAAQPQHLRQGKAGGDEFAEGVGNGEKDGAKHHEEDAVAEFFRVWMGVQKPGFFDKKAQCNGLQAPMHPIMSFGLGSDG